MPSTTISPSIDQGIKLNFEKNYLLLAQQEESMYAGAGACYYVPSEGYAHNIARMGRAELTEVATRNPKLAIEDYNLDNRQFTKKRFTKTFRIDEKDDINELIADPTSDLLTTLVRASKRTTDRQVAIAAVGVVLTGAPNEALTSTSASDDGVITIDALAGIGYDTIQTITENFINNDVPMNDFKGTSLSITGFENTEVMGITQFINNDYISGEVVNEGYAKRAGMYQIILFAGSRNGGITVPNPILPEATTTRKCIVLAPNSIAIMIELNKLDVTDAPGIVASKDVTIDMWIGTMRTEGVKVQIVQTTI